MIQFYAGLFFSLMRDLMILEKETEQAMVQRGDDFLNAHEIEETHHIVSAVKRECERVKLNAGLERIWMPPLSGIVPGRAFGGTVRLGRLGWELKALRESIGNNLFSGLFMLIPTDRQEYYDEYRQVQKLPPLFGPKVYRNFESTRDDVKEAGNCFATARYPACVFHSMRVAEKGLQAIVHDLRTRFNAALNFSTTVEEASWGSIIDEIQHTLTKPDRFAVLNPQPTLSDMTFYSRVTKEFEYFDDAWRKDVSHSRRSYDEIEAKGAMEHVKAFMQQLSNRLRE